MQTSLQGIAKKAQEQKDHRFGNLYEMLNEEYLLDCWQYIRKDAACGVDRVSAKEYEENLEENIRNLVERLKRKSYRAKLVRRQYIPKGEGKKRPLGIPATEDKLLQLAVKRILEAIYEQDFLRCSYGYRPNVGPLNAVDKLTVNLQFGRYNYIVEADIRAFFDNMDHEWIVRMLEERIDDRALIRLIKKWLKAGVLDTDGQVIHPVTGTPQGGIVSPVLSNIYLHYALDLWFHKVIKKQCGGEACLIRFADDFVSAFQYQEDAERFYKMLGERLGKFKLEMSEEKTRIIPFPRHRPSGKYRFDFLGFEFYWGKDRSGKPHLKRRTSRKKLRSSIKRFTEWCKENRNLETRVLFRRLNAKLRGYYNYYGVFGNYDGLQQFFIQVKRILFKWLNRRSQRRSYNWDGFKQLLKHYKVEQPRIIKLPKTRQLQLI
ncbi:MAG: group II intron reverse transcriptase/maturase [Proteobacteria bacterium]|nr:group II intron reverse transcriptase/maturase [Pseudomonadota bacterium]